jgi:hypothetical protein
MREKSGICSLKPDPEAELNSQLAHGQNENGLLASEPPCRQRQEQRPKPDRADLSAMNLHKWLAALFVMLALAGCAQTTEQGQTPNSPYPPEFDRHTHGGVDM